MSEVRSSRPDRPTRGLPLTHIRIKEHLDRLKKESTWRTSDRSAVTLTKGPALRVVLLTMKKGATLREHRACGPVTIQAVSGLLRLSVGGQTLDLGPAEVAILESAIDHEVEALKESALLLTLVKLR